MGDDGAARRRLVAAVVTGVALVGVLVAVQLVDDGDGAARDRVRNTNTVTTSRSEPARANRARSNPVPST